MNVLAIGNSFSMDATRYLAQIAKSDNFNLEVVNLYIGGCSLSHHFRNIMSDKKAYELQYGGFSTGFYVSVKEALLNREWDFVTMQQVSHESISYETYQPYLNELSAYVKKYAPKARQIIHQTWAYEDGSARLCNELGYKTSADMYTDIEKAYEKAAKDIDAEFIIPSGKLMQRLSEKIGTVHRDTFHATKGAARYALGLLWYNKLTGNDVAGIELNDFDEEVTESQINVIKELIGDIK